jgi:hypothetical protein
MDMSERAKLYSLFRVTITAHILSLDFAFVVEITALENKRSIQNASQKMLVQ